MALSVFLGETPLPLGWFSSEIAEGAEDRDPYPDLNHKVPDVCTARYGEY